MLGRQAALLVSATAGRDPVLIGYVDQTADPTQHAWDDDVFKNWAGGTLPGLRRLTDTDVMGTPAWLRERGIAVPEGLSPLVPKESKEPNWNGYIGDSTWIGTQDKSVDCSPFPQPAAFKQEDSDTRVLCDRAIAFIRDQGSQQRQ